MAEYARVVSVDEDIVSGQLATDHAIGTATLSLDSVLGLEEPEEGQRLTFKTKRRHRRSQGNTFKRSPFRVRR